MTNDESFLQETSLFQDKARLELSQLANLNEKDTHVLHVVTEGFDGDKEEIFD
jgi:hypothetical protein